MEILFDHQIMDAQTRGGVSRYFCKLVSTIQSENLAGVRLPRIFTDNEYFHALPSAADPEPFDVRSLLIQKMRSANLAGKEIERAWRRTRARLNQRAAIEELKRQDFDLFHPTYYDPYFFDHLQGKPFVLTIYDMIHEIYPEYFRPDDKTREHKALLAGAAARIIALSNCTKSDILRHLDVDPDKIDVIHLASPLAAESEALPVPESYVLYVGNRGRYKNFRIFLSAFASLASRLPDLHLVCVCRHGFDRAELDLIQGLGLASRCVNISATDKQLVFLYGHASLFVYPSLYEGFGLPVVEAFACGCPVALSNTSCFQEIAGEAAMYFDPSDALSIERALETMVLDGASRRTLAQRGREQLKRFSWVTTAEQTASVYKRCLAAS